MSASVHLRHLGTCGLIASAFLFTACGSNTPGVGTGTIATGASGSDSGSSGSGGGGSTGDTGSAGTGTGTVTRVGTTGSSAVGGVVAATGSLVSSVGTAVGNASTNTPAGSLVGTVATTLAQTGSELTAVGDVTKAAGVAGVPVVGPALASAATQADTALNPLAKVSVINSVLVGSAAPASQQALSVSVLQPTMVSSKLLGVGVGADNQLLIVSAGGKQVLNTGTLTSGGLTGALPLSGLSSLPVVGSLPLSSLPISSLPLSSSASGSPLSSLTSVASGLPVLSTVTGALTGATGTAGASSPLSGVTSLLGGLGKLGH